MFKSVCQGFYFAVKLANLNIQAKIIQTQITFNRILCICNGSTNSDKVKALVFNGNPLPVKHENPRPKIAKDDVNVKKEYAGMIRRAIHAMQSALKMEAVVFDGKALTVKYDKSYPMPKIVKDDDVIVKVEYAGVCGTDVHIIQGEFPARKDRPLPLGHEFSGTIYEVGKNSVFKKGQKVVVDPNNACNLCDFCRIGNYQYCLTSGINNTIGIWRNGGWAQYVCVPQAQVYVLPEGITTEQAGLCEPYSCVSHGYDRAAPLTIGSQILVLGAGIIGNLWVTTLHHQGHRDVTVSEPNKSRLEIVKKLNTGFRLITPDVLEKEKKQYDVIIDCTGVGKVMEIGFNYLRHGGKYVVFGCAPPTHQATLNPFQIYDKELSIIGVKINPFSFPKAIGWLKAMGSRYLDYNSLGVKTYSLSQYEKALNDLKTGSISKAVFKIE